MSGSGEFFKGLADLIDSVVDAAVRLRHGLDSHRRDNAIRDLLACALLAQEIVQNGHATLKLIGSDPLSMIRDMTEPERSSFGSECLRLLRDQVDRLVELSELLEDAPALGILDESLKSELDSKIGDKKSGLMAIAAPLGFYLRMGALPEQTEIDQYGENLARLRYQTTIVALPFTGCENDAPYTIDSSSTRANLAELAAAAERLRTFAVGLASKEEILVLAKKAQGRFKRHNPVRK